jgi:hypothetical protein
MEYSGNRRSARAVVLVAGVYARSRGWRRASPGSSLQRMGSTRQCVGDRASAHPLVGLSRYGPEEAGPGLFVVTMW